MRRVCTVGLIAAVGCSFDPTLDPSARLACESASDCPTGTRCSVPLGHCVALFPEDTIAPTLTAMQVSPSAGNRDATFAFTVVASKTLGTGPTLHLVASDGHELSGAVVRPTSAPRESSWSWAVAADPMTVEGRARALVDLVDPFGNASERLEVGTFEIDFTPPRVESGSERLVLQPGPDNPLTSATLEGMAPGTSADLTFVTTEPVEALALGPVPGLVFRAPETAGTFNRVVATVAPDAGELDMDVVLELHGADRSGNPLSGTLGLALHLDTIRPPLPNVGEGGVLYDRAPSGTLLAPQPHFTLEAPAHVFQNRSWVFVRELGGIAPLNMGRATADGELAPLVVGLSDRPTVEVSTADPSGNSSGWVEVKRTRVWTSFLAPGANRLELRRMHTPAAVQPLAQGLMSGTVTPVASWKRREPFAVPGCTALASDPRHGRVTGLVGAGTLWQWDGEQWRLPGVSGPTPACDRALAAWDELRDLLVVACYDAGGAGSTWEWSGSTWSQQGWAPPLVALSWSPHRSDVLGVTSTGAVYAREGWSTLASAGPPGIVSAAREGTGGALLALTALGETWRWPGADGGWAQVATGAPLGQLVAQPWAGATHLLTPGSDGGLLARTWSGAGWSVARATSAPAGRQPDGGVSACAAAEPGTDRVLVVDGRGATGAVSSNGGETLVPVPDSGSAQLANAGQVQAAGAFEAHSGRSLFVAGGLQSSLLAWSGTAWSRVPGPPTFGGRVLSSFVEDPRHDRLVLVGGLGGTTAAGDDDGGGADNTLSEVWQLTADGGWSALPDLPARRAAMAAGFCPGANGVVVQGGISRSIDATQAFDSLVVGVADAGNREGWVLEDDGGWTSLGSLGDGRAFHALAVDPQTGRCQPGVGLQLQLDRWQTSPVALQRVQPDFEAPLTANRVWLDPVRRRVFSFGGFYVNPTRPDLQLTLEASDDLAVFSNFGTTDEDGDGEPGFRVDHASAWDSRRSRLVMLGGHVPMTSMPNELWELRQSGERPAACFFAGTRGLDPAAKLLAVRFTANASATSDLSDGGTTSSIETQVWVPGRWLRVGSTSASVEVSVTDPAVLDAMRLGQSELGFALVPEGLHGHSGARVSASSFEVGIEYLRP